MTAQARPKNAAKAQKKEAKKPPKTALKLKLAAKEPATLVIENKILIKRTGKKAMRFSGYRMAEATGYNRTCSHWYEIAVFAREVGGYTASIKHFYKSAEEHDRYIAQSFDTLESAMDFIESYSPETGLAIGFDPGCKNISAAHVILRAASLRARLHSFAQAYETVCGDVLERVEAAAEKMNQAQL